MVFQNYALYPHMTVYDNIAFGLKLQHRPKAEIESRVKAVAENLDISHLLKRKPGQLSGGQQQRVALGRALVKEPLVFLLDEPFSNLDAALRSRMRTEVKHLHLKLGHDVGLRDPRPGRGDDPVRPHRGHARRQDRPVRADERDLRQAARPVRRDVRRQAQDEPRRRRARRATDGRRVVRLAGPPDRRSARRPRSACARGPSRASRWACAPRTCGSMPTAARPTPAARSRRPCSCWSRSGPTRSWSSPTGDATIVARVAPDAGLAIGQTVTAELTPGRIHLFEREHGERIVA